jgi:hypothetical protein
MGVWAPMLAVCAVREEVTLRRLARGAVPGVEADHEPPLRSETGSIGIDGNRSPVAVV